MEVVTEGKLERQIRYELVRQKPKKKTLRKRGGTKDRRLFFYKCPPNFHAILDDPSDIE